MSKTNIDLTDVITCIQRHNRFVTFVTLAAIIGGVLFFAFSEPRYTAKTEFILRNPLYGDRAVIYNNETKLSDYFGSEDDLNKIILLSGTDIVRQKVISDIGLDSVYKLDITNPLKELTLESKINSNLKLTRTEYGDMILTYRDTDPRIAIATANDFVRVLNTTFSDYYKDMRKGICESIADKIQDQDSTINALTDSLVSIRDRYGLYSSEYNVTLNSGNDNRSKKSGRGVEQIQNIELIKDELVTDRAVQTTLIDRYKTGLKNGQLPIIKVLTPARIVSRPGILEGIITALICGALGFFFSVLAMLLSDYYVSNKKGSIKSN